MKPAHADENKTYFAQFRPRGPVKIGKSVNPNRRLRHLQTGNPYKLRLVLVIDEDAERIFHIRFKHLLLRDEWYRCEGELLELIERYSELWRSGRKIIIRNGL